MKTIYVWDKAVRVFHWSLAIAFLANAFIIDDDSDLHQYVGYFIMGLLVFRLLWGFIGSTYARFSSFPPDIGASLAQMREMRGKPKSLHIGHTPLGALMIYNLLFSMAVLVISGYLMTTDQFWGVEWPEELHEFAVGWLEFSVLLHVAAVIYESIRTKINLPRAMLTGSKSIPNSHVGQDDY